MSAEEGDAVEELCGLYSLLGVSEGEGAVEVSVHPVNVGNGDCTLVRIKTHPESESVFSVLIDGGYQWKNGESV